MDHAGDNITHSIDNKILIFVNLAPNICYSKFQATINSYTFGSEVIALRNSLEIIKCLGYNLQIMGVTINGPD